MSGTQCISIFLENKELNIVAEIRIPHLIYITPVAVNASMNHVDPVLNVGKRYHLVNVKLHWLIF